MAFDDDSVAFLSHVQRDLLGPARPYEAQRRAGDVTPVPTPYESSDNYSILAEVSRNIVAALRQHLEFPDPPLVGTLPLGEPLALLVAVPDSSRHLVIVDIELAVFANLLAKAAAQGLLPAPDGTVESWTKALGDSSHPAVKRYLELMIATLMSRPAAAPQYLPDGYWEGLALELRTGIEVFVLSEPIVHLAMGHAEGARPVTVADIHQDVESYVFTAEQRAEAFAMRLRVMAAVFEQGGLPNKALGYWAIELFLFSMVLLEAVEAARFGRRPGPSQHAEEMAWLRAVVGQMEGPESRSIAMLERLAPLKDAFARHLDLTLRDGGPAVH